MLNDRDMTVRHNICRQPSACRPNSQHTERSGARSMRSYFTDDTYTRSRVYVCDGRDKYGTARLIGRQVERAISKGTNTRGGVEGGGGSTRHVPELRACVSSRRYSAHTVALDCYFRGTWYKLRWRPYTTRVRVGITIIERDQLVLMTFVDGETNIVPIRGNVTSHCFTFSRCSEELFLVRSYVNGAVIADECMNSFRLDVITYIEREFTDLTNV